MGGLSATEGIRHSAAQGTEGMVSWDFNGEETGEYFWKEGEVLVWSAGSMSSTNSCSVGGMRVPQVEGQGPRLHRGIWPQI